MFDFFKLNIWISFGTCPPYGLYESKSILYAEDRRLRYDKEYKVINNKISDKLQSLIMSQQWLIELNVPPSTEKIVMKRAMDNQ